MLDRPQQPFNRKPLENGRSHSTTNLPQIYVKRGQTAIARIYLHDHSGRRLISRLKWLISTCIIGTTGLAVIGVVMYASMNIEDGSGIVASMRREGLKALKPTETGIVIADQNTATMGRKGDRIVVTSKGLTTKHIIHDSIVQRRGTREFIQIKPYVRIVASLATERPADADAIPPLNPLDLYSNDNVTPRKEKETASTGPVLDKRMETRLIDLAGGFLPQEDGQELSTDDIERFVAEADAAYSESEANLRPSVMPGSGDEMMDADGTTINPADEAAPMPTPRIIERQGMTIAAKSIEEELESDEDTITRSIIAKPNDTVATLVKAIGAEAWQTHAITEAMTAKLAGAKIKAGQELRYTILAGETEFSAPKEPVKLTLFSGNTPLLTLRRNAAGDYLPDDIPVGLPGENNDASSDFPQRSTIYLSTYEAAKAEGLPPDFITKVLRIHSYDVDFKTRVQNGDGFELFYDVAQEDNGNETPGELLYAAFTVGGQTDAYYRFRTPDGITDYYDEKGSNAKKLLMRTPIKAGRLTSGFGYRRHPLLGIMKLHAGVDWGAPIGTPILAAGDGVIEVAGRESGYGNYIRIRHGNGYKTAYAHQSRFAPGIAPGVKVRQGQVIGYVGTTGLSTGAHLHYEVLVNNRQVNPMSIQVPRSRQLQGRLLAEFKKEKARIDDLMHRAPVKTRIATTDK